MIYNSVDPSWTMGFFSQTREELAACFWSGGPISEGAKLHGTCSIGHDHLAMVVVEAVELVEKKTSWREG